MRLTVLIQHLDTTKQKVGDLRLPPTIAAQILNLIDEEIEIHTAMSDDPIEGE